MNFRQKTICNSAFGLMKHTATFTTIKFLSQGIFIYNQLNWSKTSNAYSSFLDLLYFASYLDQSNHFCHFVSVAEKFLSFTVNSSI